MMIIMSSQYEKVISGLPQSCKWCVQDTNLEFHFRIMDTEKPYLSKEHGIGDIESGWERLIPFGDMIYANGGGSSSLILFNELDERVYGLDIEREEPLFVLNSTIKAFIETWKMINSYFLHIEKDLNTIINRVILIDPLLYNESEWKMFLEYLGE